MPAPIYDCDTEAAVALAAATAKTVLGVKAHANSGLLLLDFWLAFDGITASAVPVLVELCYLTWASNSPGTNSTSVTPRQRGGRALTAGFTAGRNWTTEPTSITPIKPFLLAPDKGFIPYQFSLGTEFDCALGEGFCIRCNAPAAVNLRANMGVSRC